MFDNVMWAGHWLWMLVIATVAIIPAWKICQRTGYPGWLGLLIVIPVVNLVLLYLLAFGEWPSERDREGSR